LNKYNRNGGGRRKVRERLTQRHREHREHREENEGKKEGTMNRAPARGDFDYWDGSGFGGSRSDSEGD
jgi:hypothetical protein